MGARPRSRQAGGRDQRAPTLAEQADLALAQIQLTNALLGPVRMGLRYPAWEFYPEIRRPCPIEWLPFRVPASRFRGVYDERLEALPPLREEEKWEQQFRP